MMNLFSILFVWTKATRCKRLIKRIRCRLKLLKNERDSVIRHLLKDIVQYIKNRQDESSLHLVEQLSKDQSIMSAYDLLDQFCEFININLPYIWRTKDLPNDINEAASSLLYASTRCGDLPELNKLKKLFRERYGYRFARAAADLLPNNLVNRQVIEKLNVKSMPFDVKCRLIKEIARENGLELDPPETEPKLELQQNQVYDRSIEIGDFDWDKKVLHTDIKTTYKSTGLQVSNPKEMQGETRTDFSLSDSTKLDVASKLDKQGKLDPLYEQGVVQGSIPSQSNSRRCSTTGKLPSSSWQRNIEASGESSFQLLERNIVYLDDLRSDNRMEPCAKSDGKTSSRSTTNKRMSSRKRGTILYHPLCQQSPASVCSSINDVECAVYYNDSRRHWRKNNQKITAVGESRSFSNTVHDKKLSSTPQNHRQNEQQMKVEQEQVSNCKESYASPRGSCTKVSPWTQTTAWAARPPYLRVAPMPPERPGEAPTEPLLRFASFQYQQHDVSNSNSSSSSSSCRHIHPKLPDYDDFKAKFTTLAESSNSQVRNES